MPRKPTNLDGQRFGKLVVEESAERRDSAGKWLYRCRCDCGKVCHYRYADLVHRRVINGVLVNKGQQSCGCAAHDMKVSEGQRFGRLTVLERVGTHTSKGGVTSPKLRCQCDCGKTVIVRASNLYAGTVQSCGCLASDHIKSLYAAGTAPCKLREAERPRRSNKSGRTGVYYNKAKGLWAAEIMLRKQKHFLGYYSNIEDAIEAREAAEKTLFEPILDALVKE